MIETILWDFDGVILNSNAIRDKGFELVLAEFPQVQIDALLDYHRRNGGLSRYNKFRYFFEIIRGESVSEKQIKDLAQKFSKIMLDELADPNRLIDETTWFIRKNHSNYQMHIVSGSDQAELRILCAQLGIARYFKSIHGSPTPKTELVSMLIDENNYDKQRTILVGDSINDFDAATENGILFKGFGNQPIVKLTNSNFHFSSC